MEVVLIVIMVLALVLPRYILKKFSDKTQFIISIIAGVLLLGLIWLIDSDGHLFYKLGITLVVIVSVFIQLRKWYLIEASK